MIVGLGTDIIAVARIAGVLQRHPAGFLERSFTPAERALGASRHDHAGFYAGRWAAKEAIAKALGTGFGAACGWQDLEILNDPLGRPVASLRGAAAATRDRLGARHLHLSLSHDREYACAVAILEA